MNKGAEAAADAPPPAAAPAAEEAQHVAADAVAPPPQPPPPEQLVFGELEEQEEAWATPLAVTRASSTVPESPLVAFHSPEEEAPPAAQQQQHTPRQPHADRVDADASDSSSSSSSSSSGDEADDDASTTPAAAAAAAAASTADDAAAAASRLLSLHELSFNGGGGGGGGGEDGSSSAAAAASPPSSTTSSSSAVVNAAAEAGLDGGGSRLPTAAEATLAAAAVAAAAEDAAAPAAALASVATPRSPVAAGASSSGLDRASSWQLQHAAAAAAGTASHPAPPRSDMDLAKLSNTPASPHGEAGWAAWQRRRRHFFVLTAAGKPVYSRHGDEQALAGFMAVIQALVSVITDQGDVIHSMHVGASTLVFLMRGQLYLVAVSSRDEAEAALRRQLELLYQSILMTVTSGVQRLLQRSPGYDVQGLLCGSASTMDALLSRVSSCPGWVLGSVEPATATGPDRQALSAALAAAVKASDCLYGVLQVGGRVMAVSRGASAPPPHATDLLLLLNFVASSESLQDNDETFVPVCLPNFQPAALVHAYVTPLRPAPPEAASEQQQQQQQPGSSSSMFLVLISGSADAFHRLSAAQQGFVAAVAPSGVLARVQDAARAPGQGRVRVEALPPPLGGPLGSTPLWHALIRYPGRQQHTTLAYPRQLFAGRSQVKQLVRSYCRLYCAAYAPVLEQQAAAAAAASASASSSSSASSSGLAGLMAAGSQQLLAGGGARPHKLVWVTTSRWVTGVLVEGDVEVYITLDPLTEKDVGLRAAEGLRRLFGDRARRAELLVPGL